MPDGGLITPVIKDADKTDIYQMSRFVAARVAACWFSFNLSRLDESCTTCRRHVLRVCVIVR